MQVDLRKLFSDQIQEARVRKPVDLRLKLEAREDISDVDREAVDVRFQVPGDAIRIADDGLEIY